MTTSIGIPKSPIPTIVSAHKIVDGIGRRFLDGANSSARIHSLGSFLRGDIMSIVRIGLAENEKFAEGYDAIFGKKKAAAKVTPLSAAKKPTAKKPAKKSAPKKK
jgi:hypothetical protein